MGRRARILDPNGVYHVIARGNNRMRVFLSENDHAMFQEILRTTKKELPHELFHYVMMPNHIHMIMRGSHDASLSEIMKRVLQGYALHFKRQYGFIGHLWQDRFKSLAIENDAYLLTCGIYIELNPVRAKMVSSPAKYPWSSYGFYAHGVADPLVDPDPTFLGLGGSEETRRGVYRGLVTSWQQR